MKPKEHAVKSAATSKSGLLATLARLHDADGSGAPAVGRRYDLASFAPLPRQILTPLTTSRRYVFSLLATLLAALLGVLACASAPALAAGPPQVSEESVSDVATSSATFEVTLNPDGAATTYTFEYASAGGAFVPVPEAEGSGSLAAGSEGVALSVHVQQGLQPNTSYDFRLDARNSAEAVTGEAVSFTTERSGGSSALPDGRQWELVTPPEKRGALIFGLNYGFPAGAGGEEPFVAKAAADGDAMVDLASAPTEAEPQGNSDASSLLSTRGPSGWSSQVIASPHDEGTEPSIGQGGEYRFFSEDLSHALLQPFANFTPLSPEATETTPYVRTNYLQGDLTEHCESSCYQPLVTAANTAPGTVFGEEVDGECLHLMCGPKFVDATPDMSHVVVSSEQWTSGIPLQLTATPNTGPLYEWSAGQLQPLYLLPKDEGGEGVVAGPQLSPIDHQLSSDGSVFFDYNGHLYLHDVEKGESLRLDVAQGVAEPSESDAEFIYASTAGSRVLFSDSKQLTQAAGGGIYECRIVEVAGGLTCELELTGLAGGYLIGGSEDATYLYFVGTGEKLIADHYDGRHWTTTEGPVVPERSAGGTSAIYTYSGFLSPSSGDELPSDSISPNGRYVAFMSYYDLTGYDTRDAVSGQPDEEVYLYDASSNKLVCASCNPTGARPVGTEYEDAGIAGGALGGFTAGQGLNIWVASTLPPWTRSQTGAIPGASQSLYEPRYLSDSGRLFFDSNDALVPRDVDGTTDVYEYEPDEVGNCTSATSAGSFVFNPAADGCVGLISAGASNEESAFLDASESGGDVFFLTTSKLSPQDVEGGYVVYDAHECTGAAPCYPAPAAQPPACTTEASCKASPTPQPAIYGLPASATFSGPGNLAPQAAVKAKAKAKAKAVKCRPRFVKEHGRCVKAKKSRRAKKTKKARNDRRDK